MNNDSVSKNEKLLGDHVESVAKPIANAFGKSECSGCKARKEKLNMAHSFTRRLFINRGVVGGSLMLLTLGKNQIVKAAWQVVGEVPDLALDDVLGFVRTANTEQHDYWNITKREKGYLSKGDLLTAVAGHRAHMADSNWMKQFTPLAKQPLPKWDLDVYADMNGYRIILTGPEYTFVTDEIGAIYRAPNAPNPPNAKDLNKAENFPGAISIGQLPYMGALPQPKPMSTWERVKLFFTPTPSTVLALDCCASPCNCSGNNCPPHHIGGNCGACLCILTCCGTEGCTTNFPPSGVCFFNVGIGFCEQYGYTCNWFQGPCNNAVCGACAAKAYNTCCKCDGVICAK